MLKFALNLKFKTDTVYFAMFASSEMYNIYHCIDESKDESNKQNDIDENRKTFQNSFNNSSSKHSDGLESNSEEEEKKQNSS